MKNILFYGGASMLAYMWSNLLKKEFNVFLGLNNKWVEIEGTTSLILKDKSEDLISLLEKNEIDTIINCSGLTGVEECEKNLDLAYKLNEDLPGEISKITSKLDIKLVHISTDHLFDGKSKNYSESSTTYPLNIYSKTKLRGEQNVLNLNQNSLIIRTNFFGKGPSYKKSFSDQIIMNLKKGKKNYLFNDVYFTPINIYCLSESVKLLLKNNYNGIFNVVGNERITKYEFGLKIAELMGLSKKLIIPISIDDKRDLVIRPKDMSLSNLKLYNSIKIKIPSLSDQIYKVI